MRALLLVLLLAACTQTIPTEEPATSAESALAQMPAWETARAAGVDFRAVGEEPGWMLDIYTQNRIVLLWDYGEANAEFPLPEPILPRWNGEIYETRTAAHTLRVEIRRTPCQDTMSGENFPTAVSVDIDGRTLTGCGRSV